MKEVLWVEFDNRSPIYLQIMNLIKQDITKGIIKAGEKLPSVRELAKDLKVNPNTIQRVYQELEREEVSFTKRGRGTFVTEDVKKIKFIKTEMAKDVIGRFVEGMEELGFTKNEMVEAIEDYKGEER